MWGIWPLQLPAPLAGSTALLHHAVHPLPCVPHVACPSRPLRRGAPSPAAARHSHLPAPNRSRPSPRLSPARQARRRSNPGARAHLCTHRQAPPPQAVPVPPARPPPPPPCRRRVPRAPRPISSHSARRPAPVRLFLGAHKGATRGENSGRGTGIFGAGIFSRGAGIFSGGGGDFFDGVRGFSRRGRCAEGDGKRRRKKSVKKCAFSSRRRRKKIRKKIRTRNPPRARGISAPPCRPPPCCLPPPTSGGRKLADLGGSELSAAQHGNLLTSVERSSAQRSAETC